MADAPVVAAPPARACQPAPRASKGAATAMRLAEDPGRFLSTVQIGITLAGFLASAAAAEAALRTLPPERALMLDTVRLSPEQVGAAVRACGVAVDVRRRCGLWHCCRRRRPQP